jgi:hypothetical protein
MQKTKGSMAVWLCVGQGVARVKLAETRRLRNANRRNASCPGSYLDKQKLRALCLRLRQLAYQRLCELVARRHVRIRSRGLRQ